eukprot:s7654_g6.t1
MEWKSTGSVFLTRPCPLSMAGTLLDNAQKGTRHKFPEEPAASQPFLVNSVCGLDFGPEEARVTLSARRKGRSAIRAPWKRSTGSRGPSGSLRSQCGQTRMCLQQESDQLQSERGRQFGAAVLLRLGGI